MHFQNMKRDAAIQSVGRTTRICFQAGCDTTLSRAKSGRSNCRGTHVRTRTSRGNDGLLSGETARSSGIREKVDEKDRRSAVKGGGWCEHRLARGEKTSSVLERARRANSGAQAGIAA